MLEKEIKETQSALEENKLSREQERKKDRIKPKYVIVGSAAFLLSLLGIKHFIGNTTRGFPNGIETSEAMKDVNAVGVVKPNKIVRVNPETDASKVVEILVKEGSIVERGQPLAILTSKLSPSQVKQYQQDVEDKYKLYLEKLKAVNQADLALASLTSESSLSPIKSIESEGGAQEAQSRIDELSITLRKLESKTERYRSLVSQGAISAQLLDDLEISYAKTQQELQSANIALTVALAKKQEDSVTVQGNQLSLEKLKAALDVARLEAETAKSNWQLSKQQLAKLQASDIATTSLYSPVDGIVVEKSAVVGDVINSSQYLMAIAEKSKFELHLVAHHYQVPCLLRSQDLAISSSGNESLTLKGLSAREGGMEPKSGKPTVIVDLPVNSQLRPDMTLELKTKCTEVR